MELSGASASSWQPQPRERAWVPGGGRLCTWSRGRAEAVTLGHGLMRGLEGAAMPQRVDQGQSGASEGRPSCHLTWQGARYASAERDPHPQSQRKLVSNT